MEKKFQRSLKISLNPTDKQKKILLDKMLASNNLRNQLRWCMSHIQKELENKLKEKYKQDYERIKNNSMVVIEKIKIENEQFKEEVSKIGLSNNEKHNKKLEKDKSIKLLETEKNGIWKEWKEITQGDSKSFYGINPTNDTELSKVIALHPRSNIKSFYWLKFHNEELDRINIERIGRINISQQIQKEESESFSSVITARTKGKLASLPRPKIDKNLDKGQIGDKDYSRIPLIRDWYYLEKDKIKIYFNRKKQEPMIIKCNMNKYFEDESFNKNQIKIAYKKYGKYSKKEDKERFKKEIVGKMIKYQQLEIHYDKDKDKFYGVVSIDMIKEIKNISNNICVIDFGLRNLFTYIILNNNFDMITYGQFHTQQQYNSFNSMKERCNKFQTKISIEKKRNSDVDKLWRILRLTRRKITGRIKTFINTKLNEFVRVLRNHQVNQLYIGNLNIKLTKSTELWYRGYIYQRLKDKLFIEGIELDKIKESINGVGSSHFCPMCYANSKMMGSFLGKKELKEKIKNLKKGDIKKLFREGDTFHCPCCGFKFNSDYVGVINILWMNDFVTLEKSEELLDKIVNWKGVCKTHTITEELPLVRIS